MDVFSIGLSGILSAQTRLDASAQNVANLNTEGVRPLEVTQRERSGGGSSVHVQQASSPRPVSYLHEAVEQLRATHQHTASLRFLAVESDLRGRVTDLLA